MKTTLSFIISVVFMCNFALAQNIFTDKREGQTHQYSNDDLQGNTDGRKTYTAKGISISFNSDWEVKIDTKNPKKSTFLKAKSPKEHSRDALQEFVHVAKRHAGKLTLSLYGKTYLKSISEAYKNFELISNKSVFINDVEWQKIVHKATVGSKNVDIINEIYLYVGKNGRYSVTCCSQENTYDRYKQEFQKIMKSVKIR